ncbi:hypothetical protein SODALDRAFT_270933 [Sodiomyces alkalinus F11]|uniref:Zn(2)-C6 fungal-type domain-containing protein n=1 Tax=Sodiomyces alkalinus (strain CBS 110278 / VKM F-3762 / F11) TaxID=1314773 RepID=A0A3N2Q0X9_SODAK|nr:hypothetical protein SODALDRAFT_270933 [Sodiomyces alkalinus F11]ROT40424.1 hypothetical protein SODALDRAFT_270933 [Sodiomyces alkalinus F11]
MAPKGSRRFNGKSRSGCSQCKRRRVKCDRVGPICSNCSRRQEPCSYLGLLATVLDNANAASGGAPSSSRDVAPGQGQAAAAQPSTRDSLTPLPAEISKADEAELKQHFSAHAWQTFSLLPDPKQCDVFSRWIPQLATRHVFIHQAMLSLSALHLCYLAPPDVKRYYALAYQYSIQASNYFRLAVRDVNEDNWLLIVMFYMCNGIFNFYRPFMDEKIMRIPCTLTPAASLHAMRSGGQFADSIRGYLERSPIRAKLQQVDQDAWARDPENRAPTALAKLAALEQWLRHHGGSDQTGGGGGGGLSSHDAATYSAALDALADWVRGLPGGKPRMSCHFVAWPTVLSEAYYSLLEANDPMALVLFLIWNGAMSHMPRRWYMVDWFARTGSVAAAELEKQSPSPLHRLWESLESEGDGTSDTGTSTCCGPGASSSSVEGAVPSQRTTASGVENCEEGDDGEQQAPVHNALPEWSPQTLSHSSFPILPH